MLPREPYNCFPVEMVSLLTSTLTYMKCVHRVTVVMYMSELFIGPLFAVCILNVSSLFISDEAADQGKRLGTYIREKDSVCPIRVCYG